MGLRSIGKILGMCKTSSCHNYLSVIIQGDCISYFYQLLQFLYLVALYKRFNWIVSILVCEVERNILFQSTMINLNHYIINTLVKNSKQNFSKALVHTNLDYMAKQLLSILIDNVSAKDL